MAANLNLRITLDTTDLSVIERLDKQMTSLAGHLSGLCFCIHTGFLLGSSTLHCNLPLFIRNLYGLYHKRHLFPLLYFATYLTLIKSQNSASENQDSELTFASVVYKLYFMAVPFGS